MLDRGAGFRRREDSEAISCLDAGRAAWRDPGAVADDQHYDPAAWQAGVAYEAADERVARRHLELEDFTAGRLDDTDLDRRLVIWARFGGKPQPARERQSRPAQEESFPPPEAGGDGRHEHRERSGDEDEHPGKRKRREGDRSEL